MQYLANIHQEYLRNLQADMFLLSIFEFIQPIRNLWLCGGMNLYYKSSSPDSNGFRFLCLEMLN